MAKRALDYYLDDAAEEAPQRRALDYYLDDEDSVVEAQPGAAMAAYLEPEAGTPKGNYKAGRGRFFELLNKEGTTPEEDREAVGLILQEPMAGLAGKLQGIRNVYSSIDPVAIKLEKLLGGPNKFTTLGGLLPSAEEAHQQNVAARNKFTEEYGDYPEAQSGVAKGELVASIAPLMAAGVATRGLGAFATGAAPELAPVVEFLGGGAGGGALKRYLSSATAGAIGGAEGAAVVSGGSDKPFSEQVSHGATVGFGLGATVPALVEGGSKLVNFFTREKGSYAAEKILKAAVDDAGSVDAAMRRLKELGPESSFADLGPNSLKLADRVNMTPGKGQTVITGALQQRQLNSAKNLLADAAKSLNVHKDYYSTFDEIATSRAEIAAPHYAEAYRANPDMFSPTIDKILATPAGQRALSAVRETMGNKMALLGVSDPALVEQAKLVGSYVPGQGGISRGFKLETLNLVKRELDAMTTAARKQAKLGSTSTTEANRLGSLAGGLRDELVKLDKTGAYKKGLEAWSDDSTSLEALEAGKNFLKKSHHEIKKELANLSAGDQRLYRVGGLQAMEEDILRSSTSSNAARRLMGDFGFKTEKVRALFPNAKSYAAFEKAAERTSIYHGTKNRILGGSSTAPRLAAGADEDIVDKAFKVAGHAFNVAAGGKPGLISSLTTGTKAGARSVMNKFTGLTPERAEAIAQLQFGPAAQRAAISKFQALRGAAQPPLTAGESVLRLPAYGVGSNLFQRLNDSR